MGKREDNKLAKALNREIEDRIKARLKGTGWRKKHHTFFRQAKDVFILAQAIPRFRFTEGVPETEIHAEIQLKPMAIDPLYWDITQMPENKQEPLSFRGWAAFKTESACLMPEVLKIGHASADAASLAFSDWLGTSADSALQTFAERPFSDLFESTVSKKTRKTNPHYGAETRVCALILEDRREEALTLARQLAPTQFRNHPLDRDHSKRVNFHELAILYLAGREAFNQEVASSRVTPRDWASILPPK